MKTRSNQMIEAMRYVCCIVVLCIHCDIPHPVGDLFNKYGRFAVPFFLLVSGYYAHNSSLAEKSIKKIKQTLCIILIHGSICIIWNCVNSYLNSGSISSWASPFFSIHTLKGLLLFNRAVFINSSFYYFFMLLYVYAFCILVGKCNRVPISNIYALSIILYAIGYCIHHFLYTAWYIVGNFLFTGIPLFFIGHMLHSEYRIAVFLKKQPWLILGAGIMTTYLETHLLQETYVTIGQTLVAIALLFLCTNNSKKTMGILSILGSECSLLIMIYHCQIRDSILLFADKSTWYFPLIVLLLSTSLGVICSTFREHAFN